ncbi:MAG: chromosome partitioning protein ParB, partial [Meiothermus silvanus]|nr:chromosome partitioning protein ParB [Allomeiothermus silvanus]
FVVGGGRRLRALERLLAEGAIPPEYPVPVRVLPKEAALEAALVENLQREDMSPAEEIEAVARLVEQVGLAEAARRTGKSQGYLKLRHQVFHHLDPQAREWLLEGMLSWTQAEALVRVSPEVQSAFLSVHGNHWHPSWLFEFLDRSVRQPLFTLEEYTAAGGTVIYDLEGKPHLGDARLAQELQIKKLAGLAEEVGLSWVDREKAGETFPVWSLSQESLRREVEQVQRMGYAVKGLTWRGNVALAVEKKPQSGEEPGQTEAAPPRPALSGPAKARFLLAAEVSQAHRFVQEGDLRRAMALFVLELADRYTYRGDRWRWSPGEYGLPPGEVREGWEPLFERLRKIAGEKPSLDSLAANPRLEEAFCLAAGMGLGKAQKPVALLGLTSEKTLKGLPTAYLNRVLEAHGEKAARTKKEALARLKNLPADTPLDLEEAKIGSDEQA